MRNLFFMKRFSFLAILSLLISIDVHSQTNETYSELGVMLGTSYYLGDLNDKHFRQTQPAANIHYRYNLNNRLAIRAGFSAGQVRGSDKLNRVDTAKFNRNLHFRSYIYELSGVIEFNFLPYETGNRRYPFSPYIFTGLAMYNFNPQSRQFDTENPFDNDGKDSNNPWLDLQPLGTEGQQSSHYPEKAPYQLVQFAIPIGIGLKLSVGDNLSIALEYGMRKLFTDYLDDVGGLYADPQYLAMENLTTALQSDKSNALQDYLIANDGSDITTWTGNTGAARANENDWMDWYQFAGLSIAYKINKKSKVCQY